MKNKVEINSPPRATFVTIEDMRPGQIGFFSDRDQPLYFGRVVIKAYCGRLVGLEDGDTWAHPCTLRIRLLEPGETVIIQIGAARDHDEIEINACNA